MTGLYSIDFYQRTRLVFKPGKLQANTGKSLNLKVKGRIEKGLRYRQRSMGVYGWNTCGNIVDSRKVQKIDTRIFLTRVSEAPYNPSRFRAANRD